MKMTEESREIDKIYRRRDRYEIPDWQRDDVWDEDKKRLLIDTILRGWTLPKFYFMKVSSAPDTFEVVDGQQRLNAIFEFCDGDLELPPGATKAYGGRKYDDLDDAHHDAFDDFKLQYDVIEEATDTDVRNFFQRLQAGLPLTASENLNSVVSNLRDFARLLVKKPFFKKVRFADRRYAHFDVTSKVLAIAVDGLNTSLRYPDLKATYEANDGFSDRSATGRRISKTFDYLDTAFPTKNAALSNRTIVQSVATVASVLVEAGTSAGTEAKFREFVEWFVQELSRQVELGPRVTDADFIEFQKSINANVRSAAKTRHVILLRKLFAFDPAFAVAFDPASVQSAGIAREVSMMAQRLREAIVKANVDYASRKGGNLFSTTTKTTQALHRLDRPASSVDEFSKFIADLYFLVWEGPGNRIATPPQTFVDVNSMRTGFEHDLEHGKSTKTRARQRQIGAAFSSYSGGATAPETVDPAIFPAAQAKLLRAVAEEVERLRV